MEIVARSIILGYTVISGTWVIQLVLNLNYLNYALHPCLPRPTTAAFPAGEEMLIATNERGKHHVSNTSWFRPLMLPRELLSHSGDEMCLFMVWRAFQSLEPSLSLLLRSLKKKSSDSNKKLRKLSWWPNMESQDEGHKIVCYLPDVLTKCIILLNQSSFWTLHRKGNASEERY